MSQTLQLRRNPFSLIKTFTGAQGETVMDTTNNRLVVNDGFTVGGWAAAKLNDVNRLSVLVRGLNLNAMAGDNAVAISLPQGMNLYRVPEVLVGNPSAIPVAAHLGLYTGPSQGGTTIAAQQVLTGITTISQNTAGNALSLTLSTPAVTTFNAGTLYLNIGTPNVASMTVDVVIVVSPLS